MLLRYLTLVMAGMMATLAQSATAQMPVKPNDVRTQLSQAGAPAKPAAAAAPAKPAAAAAPAKPAAPAAPAKPAASAKPAAPTAQNPATPVVANAPTAPSAAARRDPFDPLLGRPSAQGAPSPDRLPPGKAGLMIGTLRLDGLVRGPNGMIAVVSNPQQRVYFLRQGDRIFDGQVLRITMEQVSFQQTGRDAFGNSLDHEVTRRLYPSPGEQR